MAMTDFTIIRRSLMSRFFSTAITTLTVATAVGLLLVLLLLPEAGKAAFARGNGNMHMLISRDPSSLQSILNGIFYARVPGNTIEWSKYQQIRQAYPMLAFAIPVQQGDSYRGFPVLSTEKDFFTLFRPGLDEEWSFAEGRVFEKPFELVIGAKAAREVGLSLGEELYLTHGSGASRAGIDDDADETEAHEGEEGGESGESGGGGTSGGDHDHDEGVHHVYPYTVVGILDSTGGPHDRAIFSDLTSSWIIHAHERRLRELGHVENATTAADLTDADRLITGIYVRVATREGSKLSGAQQQVFNRLRSDPTITVADPVQEIGRLFQIVGHIDDIFLGMAIVVMISSGIAILLALYNSMEQRRRQIAVLRVLGCSQGRVFGLIVTESAMLGIAGALVGIVFAYFGAQAVATMMNVRLGLVIDPTLPVPQVVMVAMATVALASGAGLIPAYMAYRTPVVQNLRPLG